VVLSLASIDPEHGLMTWAGVGNVQGALMRAGARKGSVQEVLLLRGGVVGSQLPALQAAVLPVAKGDTLVFVTDGIRGEFARRSLRAGIPAKSRGENSGNVTAGEMMTRSFWW